MEEIKENDKLSDIIDDIIENEELEIKSENEDLDDIDDLLEENSIDDENSDSFFDDDDDDDERTQQIIDEFVEDEKVDLDNFDIDKYLKENYSFKEIEAIPLEEYKKQQLQNNTIKAIENIYSSGSKLKELETFDDFLKFKKTNAHIFLVKIGLPFEYEMFGMEPKFFICRSFSSRDYSKMMNDNPDAESDLDYYNDFLISSCVLYPEIRMEDVEKLEYGIADVLLSAIIKHSRFNTNYRIERL